MDDRNLDHLLDDAARTYRVPGEVPFDAIWNRVEEEAFQRPTAARFNQWKLVAGVMAASLLVGVFAGRWSVRESDDHPRTAQGRSGASTRPAEFQQATEEYLGQTVVMLASFAQNRSSDRPNQRLNEGLVTQAADLLSTTRLLIDSPVGSDPRMKKLLQDLELVFAQVARLQGARPRDELRLINNALEARDLVPRIRSAAADYAAGDH